MSRALGTDGYCVRKEDCSEAESAAVFQAMRRSPLDPFPGNLWEAPLVTMLNARHHKVFLPETSAAVMAFGELSAIS